MNLRHVAANVVVSRDRLLPASGRHRSTTRDSPEPATICFPFAGGIMGGSHISALKLINALDPREFRALIVLHSSKGQLGEFLRYEKIAYYLAPTPRDRKSVG